MGILDDVKTTYVYTACNKPVQILKNVSDSVKGIGPPDSLEDCVTKIKAVQSLMDTAEAVSIKMDATDLKGLLEDKFKRKIEEWEQEEYEINTKYEDMLDSKIHSLEDEAKDLNRKKRVEFDENNRVYLRLEEKRKQLESYSDDIVEICSANSRCGY